MTQRHRRFQHVCKHRQGKALSSLDLHCRNKLQAYKQKVKEQEELEAVLAERDQLAQTESALGDEVNAFVNDIEHLILAEQSDRLGKLPDLFSQSESRELKSLGALDLVDVEISLPSCQSQKADCLAILLTIFDEKLERFGRIF